MSWLRIDDGFMDHEKVRALADKGTPIYTGAVTLWLAINLYCARNHTDGRLAEADALRLTRIKPARGKRLLAALMDVGLLERDADQRMLVVHDFLDFNKSKAQHKADRASDAERQRRYRATKNDAPPISKVDPKVDPNLGPSLDPELEIETQCFQASRADVTPLVTLPPTPSPIDLRKDNDDNDRVDSDPAPAESSSSIAPLPLRSPEVVPLAAVPQGSVANVDFDALRVAITQAGFAPLTPRSRLWRLARDAAPFAGEEIALAMAQAKAAQGEPNGGLVAYRILENRKRPRLVRPQRIERETYMMQVTRQGLEMAYAIDAENEKLGIGLYAKPKTAQGGMP